MYNNIFGLCGRGFISKIISATDQCTRRWFSQQNALRRSRCVKNSVSQNLYKSVTEIRLWWASSVPGLCAEMLYWLQLWQSLIRTKHRKYIEILSSRMRFHRKWYEKEICLRFLLRGVGRHAIYVKRWYADGCRVFNDRILVSKWSLDPP